MYAFFKHNDVPYVPESHYNGTSDIVIFMYIKMNNFVSKYFIIDYRPRT